MRRSPRVLTAAFAAALVAAAVPALSASAAPATVSSYVVVLEPGSASAAAQASRLASRYGGQVGFVYSHALRGFSIRTTDRAAVALSSNPNVAYVEPDGVMSIAEQTNPTGVLRVNAGANVGIDGSDDKRVDVDVAVIDTGIDFEHPDLNVVKDGSVNCLSGSCLPGGDDDQYHGTHVAGTIAALDNGIGVVGVAPGARLWAVKVLNKRGSGSWSSVIAGVDWVAGQSSTIDVANMSLGGGYSQAVNDAVAGAVGAGVSLVVAAGNSAADAANYSPASERSAITVSALADFNGVPGGGAPNTCRSDVDDTFASFSNFGDPIDIIAPGVCILSTYPLERGSYATISGTSMASPHVAGAVALLRSTGLTRGTAETELRNASSAHDEPNNGWNSSDDPDEVPEPLLDTTGIVPNLLDTSSTGGGGDTGGGDPDPGTGSVAFDGSSSNGAKGTWSAKITVTGGVPGTTYSGTWSPTPPTDTMSACLAGSSGSCTIEWTGIAKKVASVTWTPTNGQAVPISKP